MADVLPENEVDVTTKVTYRVRYRTHEGDEREVRVNAEGIAQPAEAALELGLTTVRGSETRRVRVKPTVPVTMLSCEAILACDVSGADALYLNGYNSWTDSRERSVRAAMRGLYGVPRRLIDREGLDGNGDYRFTPQDHRRGYQHGFGYGYLRYGEDVLLVGSLDEDNGFTTIFEDLPGNLLTLSKEVPQRPLEAGEQVELMAFALVEGALEQMVERWLALAGVTPRPAAPLVGFSSWYRYFGQISQEKLATDFAAVSNLLASRELGPCKPIFQIDDGYAKVGDWTSPDETRFPDGMGYFAQRCHEQGLLAGLWMAPFVCETDSRLYREHPDWLLRDEQGNIQFAGSNWSGYYPLDTLNPEVRAYIAKALDTATRVWGYNMLKLDFLFAACMLPHGGMNRGQLMADALELLRSSVPDDVSFDMCGVPLTSALGKTEYCRIGCDVSLDWDDVPWKRMLHRERISTKHSLGNTRGRAHLDRRAFRNDPDVFFLRKDVKLGKKRRSDLINADAALGGMFLTSDDVQNWTEDQLLAYDLALAVFVGKEQ